MFTQMRRALVHCTKDSSFLRKSHVSFSCYFSTSIGDQSTTLTASGVASALNHLKNPENPCLLISFLKENGFSETQLDNIIESRPLLLRLDLEKNLKPKFSTFKEMGFSQSQITEIITKEPWILSHSLKNKLIPSLSVLNGLMGSSVEMTKLLTNCSWFLSNDLEKSLLPNIEILTSCGIPMNLILKVICVNPRFFLVNTEIMRRCVDKTIELEAGRSSKMFLVAVRVLASMTDEIWERKWQAYRNLGFSDGDILSMFRRAPQVFSLSVEKIKKIKDVLLATGKYDLSCILSCPLSLTTSIEKRYKPRFQLLQVLERKNLIKKWPSLRVVHLYSDERFAKGFVKPYLNEVGEVYMQKLMSAASI